MLLVVIAVTAERKYKKNNVMSAILIIHGPVSGCLHRLRPAASFDALRMFGLSYCKFLHEQHFNAVLLLSRLRHAAAAAMHGAKGFTVDIS